jgi:hypothetical protein
VNTSSKNRLTNNPYLTGIAPAKTGAARPTFGSEIKRLLGSPLRLPATLLLVIGPLLLALAGALDLLSVWLYTAAHRSQGDPRPVLNIFKCLQDQTKKLCQGAIWASPTSPRRLTLYPWHDSGLINRFEPYIFAGFLALAVLAFGAIGNPNLAQVGRTLKLAAGLKARGQARGSKGLFDLAGMQAATTTGPVPRALLDPDHPEEFWRNHLLLGQFVPRYWESDPGYFWFDKEAEPVPYWLNLHVLRTGLIIVAPQGSGKTASIFKPLRNFMERSHSAGIFYDVKSSENANGIGTDFPAVLFNLNFDAALTNSIKLNIFAGQTPAQAGERLAEALIPDLGGDKAYFSNNAKSAMASIVACYHAIFHKYPSLVQILNYLSNPESLEDLNKRLLLRLAGPQGSDAFRLSTLLRRVINLSANKTTDTLGNLATALEPLVTDVAARLLVTNPQPGAYTLEELLKEPRLVRLALPIANNPRIYPIIGRLVLAQFTYAVLSPECNRNIFKLIAVDEARFFITDNVANGMAQARSNNAGFALSFQSLTQVRDETLLDNIFANAGSKLVMGKVGDKDAERYSRLFGAIELPYVSHSSSLNQGVNTNSSRSYSRGLEFEMMSGGTTGRESRTTRSTNSGRSTSTGRSQGTNLATRPRRRFLDSEVRELQQRHAIMESSDDQGRQWFAQVVNMDFQAVQNLEKQVHQQLTRLVKKSGKSKYIHEDQPVLQGDNQGGESSPDIVSGQKVKVRFMPATTPPPEPDPARVTPPPAETSPIVAVAGEVIPLGSEATPTIDIDQLAQIEKILAAVGITGRQATELAEFALANQRAGEDLNRLIDYSKNKNPDNLAAYITSMVRKDKYPAAIMSTRKTNLINPT